MKKVLYLITVALTMVVAGCDESAADLGIDIMPSHDAITTTDSVFRVATRTIQACSDSIAAATNDCYLGSVIDPETGVRTTCDFLAQFHIINGFSFPPIERMVKGSDNLVHADSVDLTLYFDEFTGDTLSTMKLTVHELDPERTMREDSIYTTNISPADFVKAGGVTASKSYTIHDLSSGLSTQTYYRTVNVRLPREYGDYILQTYYEHPEYYKSSYQFIRNVCPGFYFEQSGGVGAMLKAYVTALHVFYTLQVSEDSVTAGLKRMASTTEVIQSTRVENSSLERLDTASHCTYLRSPSGLYTEIQLPVDEIIAGEHALDSINNARIIFRRQNVRTEMAASDYKMAIPQNVLLVTKKQMYEFFRTSRLPDNRTSYLGTFDNVKNAYVFANIAGMISAMRTERDNAAEGTLSEDWNKAVLIPVNTATVASTDAYGNTSTSIYAVRNMYGLSSIRLEGGAGYDADENPVELSVIYSRYAD